MQTQIMWLTDQATALPSLTSTAYTPLALRSGHRGDQSEGKTVDGEIIQGERRGGIGGSEIVVNLQDGERITGVAGVVCTKAPHGTHVNQLLFFSQRQDGQKLTYRYALTDWMCHNGKINSTC